MKNKFTKIAVVAAVSMALVQTLQAVPITGNIGFAGNVVLNTGTAATATTATGYSGSSTPKPVVQSGSGSIIVLAPVNTQVTFAAPWVFYPGSAVPVTPLWTSTLANGLTFSLSSWTSTRGVNGLGLAFVTIAGLGIMSDLIGDGPTAYNFSVTFQDPASNPTTDTFTFSASQAPVGVPDGGMTVLLLGAALTGLFLVRKQVLA